MTVFDNEDPADPSAHEPKVTGAPNYIWLVYGELEYDDTHENCYRDGEVTWCQDQQYSSDVRYVRADLFKAIAAQPKPAPALLTEEDFREAREQSNRDYQKFNKGALPSGDWDAPTHPVYWTDRAIEAAVLKKNGIGGE
jgi:hypothetical protein